MKLVSSAPDLRRGAPSRPLRLAAAAGLAVVALGGLSACAEGNPKYRTDYSTPESGPNPSAAQSLTGAPPEATVVSSPTPTAVPTSARPTTTARPKTTGTPTAGGSATPSPTGSPTP